MMLPSREDYEPLSCMQVHVRSLLSGPLAGSALLDTSPNSTVESLIHSFCDLKSVCYSSHLTLFDENNRPLTPLSTLEEEGIQDGSGLLIANRMRYDDMPGNSWRYLGVLAFTIGGGSLIAVILLHTLTGGKIPFDYGIVIDGGSTHTQALLYRWFGNKDLGTGEVFQENSCSVDGGIDSTDDPSDMLKCVDNLVQSIPSTAKAHSYLYFGATAGMRLLNLTSPRMARLIILNLRCALPKAGIAVKSVNIITGEVEGVSAWITTNILTKTLHLQKGNETWNGTYGALDMGGASTQYAFATDLNKLSDEKDVTNLRLYGRNYSVISKSYLCYGLSEAFRRHFALLVEDLNSTQLIIDPCLPKENTTLLTAEYLFNHPCTQTIKFEKWVLSDPKNMQRIFTFQGGSDYVKCRSLVIRQLNYSACKTIGFEECAEPASTSLTAEKFMAFSSFFYVTSFLNSTNASLEEFLNNTANWCSKSGPEINGPLLFNMSLRYCFGGFYIAEWMTGIYGFNDSTWGNLIFMEKVGNSDVGWALGYMINATNAIPEESPSPPIFTNAAFVVLIVLCCLLLMCGIFLIFRHLKHKRQKVYKLYDPLIVT